MFLPHFSFIFISLLFLKKLLSDVPIILDPGAVTFFPLISKHLALYLPTLFFESSLVGCPCWMSPRLDARGRRTPAPPLHTSGSICRGGQRVEPLASFLTPHFQPLPDPQGVSSTPSNSLPRVYTKLLYSINIIYAYFT